MHVNSEDVVDADDAEGQARGGRDDGSGGKGGKGKAGQCFCALSVAVGAIMGVGRLLQDLRSPVVAKLPFGV